MIREFPLWWCRQLADLLPGWLRRSALTATNAMVIATVGALGGVDAVAIALRRRGKETQLGPFDLASLSREERPRAPGGTIVLRLNASDVLAKTLTLPFAAGRELRQALTFEMDRETPFKPDELYWSHRLETAERQKDRLSVRLMLVPKVSLAPLLEALDHVGIRPSRAEIATADDLPRLRARLAELRASAGTQKVTLEGSSDAIASANLQSRIAELAAAIGAAIGSTESLPAEVRGGYRRIGLRYALSGPYETLVKFLARLEMATPPLVIDNLQIRGVLRRPGTAAVSTLDAGLDIYGFRNNENLVAANQ